MQALLIEKDLWNVTSNPKPESGSDLNDVWKRSNERARAALTLHVTDTQLTHFAGRESAHDVWEHLKHLYQRSTYGSRVYLRTKLSQVRYKSGTMSEHITRVLALVNQLRLANAKVDDEEIVAYLFASLPDSYSGLVTALEGRDEADLTLDYVIGKLEDQYRRRMETGQQSTKLDSETALQSTSGRQGRSGRGRGRGRGRVGGPGSQPAEDRTCYNCNRPGHLRRNCPETPQCQPTNNSRNVTAHQAGQGRDSRNGGEKVKSQFAFHGTAIQVKEQQSVMVANNSGEKWCIDSGASSHMLDDKKRFQNLSEYKTNISLADKSSKLMSTGIGEVKLSCKLSEGETSSVKLLDVLYMPNLSTNLLSVRRMTRAGMRVIFEGDRCMITTADGQLVAEAFSEHDDDLYWLRGGAPVNSSEDKVGETAFVVGAATLYQWHRRFGHRDLAAIKRLVSEKLVTGITVKLGSECNRDCDSCARGKLTATPFPKNSKTRASMPGMLIHCDLCGPMQHTTPSGNRYVLTFTDDYSRFTVVALIHGKDEVPSMVKEFINAVKTKFNRTPATFRSDNGKEFVNRELLNYFKSQGIEHQTTVPYTPQQNGVAERKNRTLVEMGRCMLLDAGLALQFWGEAISTAAYLINRLPSRSVDTTPYEKWYGRKPDTSHLRIFGSKVYRLVPHELRKKWDDCAVIGILVGYSTTTKGYRILDPKTNKVTVSRSVRIVESEPGLFPVQHNQKIQLPEGDVIDCDCFYESTPEHDNNIIESEQQDLTNEPDNFYEENDLGQQTPPPQSERVRDKPCEPHAVSSTRSRWSTRSTAGKAPERYDDIFMAETKGNKEPVTWSDVMKLSQRERKLWVAAAEEEMKSLREYHVWDVVDLPPGFKTITAKWVFKAKLDGQGHIHTYKARLVARGFSQRNNIDYDETFAPVVRHETVRTLLTVAALRNLHVRHLDVKCAYLNGELDEELYLEQPDGFVIPGQENKVLRLRRSLYGLKQSARAWNKKATEVLRTLGFKYSKADPCLFTRIENDGNATYVLIYVDDLLVAATTEQLTESVGVQLDYYFNTKDLGGVAHYLGINVERESDGSFLIHQRQKVIQMLKEYGMADCRPASTPMETGFPAMNAEDSPQLPNNNKYRQAIGSLLYLATVSRPDIALAVGYLCRKVSTPTEKDWSSVKRVLRYLSGTKDQKLRFSSTAKSELVCYCDADWAGDKVDRKSTSGYLFQLGTSTIAWCSQKQKTVALSSTEAEYVAVSLAARELLWLRQLLFDMGGALSGPTTILEDNQGCIKMVESNRLSSRTKHIDISHHFLRDLQEEKVINMIYCPTEQMTADLLTKPLTRERHYYFKAKLGIQTEHQEDVHESSEKGCWK